VKAENAPSLNAVGFSAAFDFLTGKFFVCFHNFQIIFGETFPVASSP
jgi:hypothetical protein